MADHDHGYKLLFSHAPLVADLLRGFVQEDWVGQVDVSTLERVGGGYVSDDLRERESDVVWRLKWGGESWVYVYLLLEFQSTVDLTMALRVLSYVSLLYQDLHRQRLQTRSGRLPPVMPIVLYNGSRPWHAALDVAELIEEVPGGLERHRPSLRYWLIDESRLAESEQVSERNLAAALFRLETSGSLAGVDKVVAALSELLAEPEHLELRRAFTIWLTRVLLPSRLPGVHVPALAELREVRSMLAEHAIDWTREWKEQGREEGREEGLHAMRLVALDLLEQRFGPLSEEARRQVEAVDSLDELAGLARRALRATSLAELGL